MGTAPARAAWAAALLIATAAVARADYRPLAAASGMVASAHPLASAIGRDALRDGGSAADAAIATALALAVVEPYASGLGGGGFFVTFDAGTGVAGALDARETAPAAARRDMYVVSGEVDPALSRDGAHSVAVPGLVAGLWALHQRSGRLPWPRLVAPAARLAREGFPVDPALHRHIDGGLPRFNAAARAIFAPRGVAPAVGARLVQADLAKTLDAIAAKGPAAFYRGAVAKAIAEEVARGGGALRQGDLAAYRAKWRTPVRGRYRGLDILSMPPPSSGGVHLVEMLNVLSHFDLAASGYGSADTWHPMIEAMKFAYADRSRFLGDPDFVEVPVTRLTSGAYAAELAARIDMKRATPPGSVQGYDARAEESPDTTHISVVDRDGNAVAATLTINLRFGSGWVAAGTGVVLNDEMDDFSAAEGVPNAFGLVGSEANAIAPGKRPLSSMTPTIALEGGKVKLVVGSPGGSRIITTTLQVIVNVVDFGMDIAAAVRAPRIHHQWRPEVVYYEPWAITPDTAAILRGRGHALREQAPSCNAQGVMVGCGPGAPLCGASDPRGVGTPAGY